MLPRCTRTYRVSINSPYIVSIENIFYQLILFSILPLSLFIPCELQYTSSILTLWFPSYPTPGNPSVIGTFSDNFLFCVYGIFVIYLSCSVWTPSNPIHAISPLYISIPLNSFFHINSELHLIYSSVNPSDLYSENSFPYKYWYLLSYLYSKISCLFTELPLEETLWTASNRIPLNYGLYSLWLRVSFYLLPVEKPTNLLNSLRLCFRIPLIYSLWKFPLI